MSPDTEDTKVVENVYGDTTQKEYSEKINKKAKALVDFLQQEPAAKLIPTLKVTEMGIIPDVRLVLADVIKDKNETETNETDTVSGAEEGDKKESK